MADKKGEKEVTAKPSINIPSYWNHKPSLVGLFDSSKQDDIVDKSNYRPSSETKRDMQATGKIGAGDKGVYDFASGVMVTDNNKLTTVELLLRQGRLQRADIEDLKRKFQAKADSDARDAKAQAAIAEAQKANVDRQAKMDAMIEELSDSTI